MGHWTPTGIGPVDYYDDDSSSKAGNYFTMAAGRVIRFAEACPRKGLTRFARLLLRQCDSNAWHDKVENSTVLGFYNELTIGNFYVIIKLLCKVNKVRQTCNEIVPF